MRPFDYVRIADELSEAGIPRDEALVEARILFQHVTGLTREQLFLQSEIALSPEQADRLNSLVERRTRREPLAYILGEREFYGMRFAVTPAVLIPRPETELLVDLAIETLKYTDQATIADIGTGSGCIAIAIARHLPDARVLATDISPEALAVAESNGRRLSPDNLVTFLRGDLLAPLPTGMLFDAILSNPPYIAPAEIQHLEPEVRDWEPRVALGENPDALHFYRRLATEAPAHLKPGGILAVEVGQGQAEAVAYLWQSDGLIDITIIPDLVGIPRVVTGRKA